MAGLVTAKQQDELFRFIRNPYWDKDSLAREFLLQNPLSGLSISPDNVSSAYLVKVSAGPFPIFENFVVPSHFLQERNTVLGHSFVRTYFRARKESDWYRDLIPVGVRLDPSGLSMTAVSRFALHLPSGNMVQTCSSYGGEIVVTDVYMQKNGFPNLRYAGVKPDGGVTAHQMELIRSSCDAPSCNTSRDGPGSCSCAGSLENETSELRQSFSHWSQMIERGKNRGTVVHEFLRRDLGEPPGAITHSSRGTWTLQFDADNAMIDMRCAYLNYLTVYSLNPDRFPYPLTELDVAFIEPDAVQEAEEKLRGFYEPVVDLFDDQNEFILPLEGDRERSKGNSAGSSQSPYRYVCSQCNVSFARASNRDRHIASAHVGRKAYECRSCGLQFAQMGNLKRHIQVVHLGCKRFKCPACAMPLTTKANLQRHMLAKHKAPATTIAPTGAPYYEKPCI